MKGEVLPLDYLNTPLICRWRFLLGGGFESEKKVDEIIPELVRSNEIFLLTALRKDLHVLAKLRKVGENSLKVILDPSIYKWNYDELPDDVSLTIKWGMHSILTALVLGGIEDLRRESNYPEEYREHILSKIPDNPRILIGGKSYLPFESSAYLLMTAISIKSTKASRAEEFMRWGDERIGDMEQARICMACPFSSYCDVSTSGGHVKDRIFEIFTTILNGAIYAETLGASGWYLLYRTAKRYLSYSSNMLWRAFTVEAKRMIGEINLTSNDFGRYVRDNLGGSILDEVEVEYLLTMRNRYPGFPRGKGAYIPWEDFANNGPPARMMEKGILEIENALIHRESRRRFRDSFASYELPVTLGREYRRIVGVME